MAKINFTAGRINGHSCPNGKAQAFLWDSGASGLGLRATAAGARTFIWQGKVGGGTVRMSIGDPRDWGIDDARDEARRLKRLVDAGKDPREEAAEQRAAHEARKVEARRQSALVSDAWSAYLVYLATSISPKTGKPRSPRYIADHKALAAPGGEELKRGKGTTVRGPLAPLMAVKLPDLSAKKIATWLSEEASARPANAAHAFRLLRAFVHWCAHRDEFEGAVQDGVCDSKIVKDVVPKSHVKQGDCLQREQLGAWFSAVCQLDNPVASAYLQATLLTGARREEMAQLKWSDLDFRWGSMHVRDKIETVTGRVIPLGAYLASVLNALPRRNEFVFSSHTAESGRIEEPRYPHSLALSAAGLGPLTIHGLRRSFASLTEWVEVPAGVSAQIMGHAPSAVAERHYIRRSIDQLRHWNTRIEAWFLAEAGIQFDPEQTNPGLRVVNGAT
ncbi:tyrosine-type recombinase/integrase [Paraburkholderia ginsengisoli]|uniref:Integrase family protein n=1 Tax=Paraburkholderia ginsengisoli TaxID=311231 RepID=A0A7T4N1Z5_9BURK|nr:integrase family protein [Paraburkholderia ginsengisoli]QQC63792.1 integrase family protein [Paraburkholderia ginsengisoli]